MDHYIQGQHRATNGEVYAYQAQIKMAGSVAQVWELETVHRRSGRRAYIHVQDIQLVDGSNLMPITTKVSQSIHKALDRLP
ncbi:hypothetical protein [Pinirhizobacter sp.]|jgi:hypothetical protein|uniref:hypothetical protein n=1 Tax=Pinirhizobacter sp. TaxID=2950432 RepID=UPI002F42CDF4